jgi:hypothetical protein
MNNDATAHERSQRVVAAVETTMTQKIRTKSAHRKHTPRSAIRHPHGVATILPQEETERLPDQPFVEGAKDELDPDLRHRLISEAAFHRQAERGCDEGYDRDDWLEAEADVDHIVIGQKAG